MPNSRKSASAEFEYSPEVRGGGGGDAGEVGGRLVEQQEDVGEMQGRLEGGWWSSLRGVQEEEGSVQVLSWGKAASIGAGACRARGSPALTVDSSISASGFFLPLLGAVGHNCPLLAPSPCAPPPPPLPLLPCSPQPRPPSLHTSTHPFTPHL